MTRFFSLLAFAFMSIVAFATEARNIIHLWEGTSVGNKSVTLEVFLPENHNVGKTPAMIVCPGGSYSWHDYEVEGTDVARWLSKNGIAAFVLNYRVQGVFNFITHARLIVPGNHHPYMLQDGQRAIQYVREHADEYNIDINKVGAIGFSAGGHLVMSLAEFSSTDFLKPLGLVSKMSLRPDFAAPIYPVVTMREKVCHTRSRRALLGEYGKFRKSLRDSLSLERHVPSDCPHIFLVNCKDDPIVKYQNSELLDSALSSKGIKHTYIQYQTGGHGFGASDLKGTAESRQWKQRFLEWLREIKILM